MGGGPWKPLAGGIIGAGGGGNGAGQFGYGAIGAGIWK